MKPGKGQVYQFFYETQCLAENEDLTELLLYVKEQINEEAWEIPEEAYGWCFIKRVENMEFDFETFMIKGTGLKKCKK